MHRTALRFGVLLLIIVGLVACSDPNRYDVTGRIVGFGDDTRIVIIEHDPVPGLMPAMTMPFKVLDVRELVDLQSGDAVRFTLQVTRDSSWIYNIAALPGEGGRETAPTDTYGPMLQVGDAVPDFALVDQDGRPLRLADFAETAFVVTFIYTRCPLPEYCVLMSRNMQQIQRAVGDTYGDRLRLLTISFDTENDTPEVLREYARKYTSNTDAWSFAVGTDEEIARLSEAFGVYYMTAAGEINHNLVTALVGPDGRVVSRWRGNDWSPDEVIEAVEELLTGSAKV
jgi:protein SCO1